MSCLDEWKQKPFMGTRCFPTAQPQEIKYVHKLRGPNHHWPEKTQDSGVLLSTLITHTWQKPKAIRRLAARCPQKPELSAPPGLWTELPSGAGCLQRLENPLQAAAGRGMRRNCLPDHPPRRFRFKQTAWTSTFQLSPVMFTSCFPPLSHSQWPTGNIGLHGCQLYRTSPKPYWPR